MRPRYPIHIFAVAIFGLNAVAACASGSPTAADETEQSAMVTETAVLDIEEMSCMSCAGTIASTLGDKAGVRSVDVDFGNRRAVIDYRPDLIDPAGLVTAVESMGYPTTLVSEDRDRETP